ncbi:MAG TPA: UGSC family (seleno)protein [Gaiellaceae bacterium]
MESRYGIPTVGVHVDVFATLVRTTVKTQGMPSARQAFVPTPLMNTAVPVLREYVEGNDPVHGRPFMAEVFDQLTRPVPKGELRGEDWDRATPRYVEAASEADMDELFRERRYTDFLPIVLPTEERVERMLAGTSHAPDEMVGKMRPTIGMEFWHYDVERVAVNAVMAGAAPEHFPVILALASSGDTGRQSSMSSMGNMVVVNGPIRHEIGMNCGIGAMGPYNYANAAIGRAFGLLSQNLQGGSVPGDTYNGSQGSNLSYNCCCFAENEEASPWEPYHVEYGYDRDESAVTVSYIWGNVWSEYLREYWQEKLVAMISGLEPGMGCTLVLDPIVAREFVEKGFDSKQKLAEWIHENAKIPRRRYWDHVMLNMIHEVVEAGIEPFAGYWAAGPDELIPVFETNRVNVVVAGGETNGHFSIFMGSPMRAKFRANPGQNATVSIDAWR